MELARARCPTGKFHVADAYDTPLFEEAAYDTVVCCEFLEHVTDDLRVLGRIRRGVRFLGTVPNFPHVAHVRHFADAAAVLDRYRGSFSSITVDAWHGDAERTHSWFMIDGRV